jgi:hypothetical protein
VVSSNSRLKLAANRNNSALTLDQDGFAWRENECTISVRIFMSWLSTSRDHKRTRAVVLEAMLFNTAPSETRKEHLRVCESCASEVKELSSLFKLLDEWQTPEPSPYFDTRLRARLRAERDAGKPSWKVMQSSGLRWRFAVVSGLASALIVYGLFVAPRRISTQSGSAPSAVVDLQSLDRDADILSEINWLESGDESD